MSIKIFEEINVKFPKNNKKLESSFKNCWDRKKFIEVPNKIYSKHLELAKDDLSSIKTDFENENWRWVITKSYYAVFHATNALLVNKLGFFSKDHLCAVISLKKEDLIPNGLYKELGIIYEKFSDIFGFAVIFEARKLSQYDTEKWKEFKKDDANIIFNFAKKFVSFVEEDCDDIS